MTDLPTPKESTWTWYSPQLVEVTEIVGSAFYCYSTLFDYDTAYDLSDGIAVEQVESVEA